MNAHLGEGRCWLEQGSPGHSLLSLCGSPAVLLLLPAAGILWFLILQRVGLSIVEVLSSFNDSMILLGEATGGQERPSSSHPSSQGTGPTLHCLFVWEGKADAGQETEGGASLLGSPGAIKTSGKNSS